MKKQVLALSLALAVGSLVTTGCGSDGMTNPPGQSNNQGNNQGNNNQNNNNNQKSQRGPITAVVDGSNWAADPRAVYANALPIGSSSFLIGGSQADGMHSQTINITIYNITGPGTYPLGVDSSVYGGTAQWGDKDGAWHTEDTGESGTITITALTTTRIAGTFAYNVIPGHRNMAQGMHMITNGQFDLPLKTPNNKLPLQPEGKGSRVTAMIGGVPYHAASVYPDTQGGTAFGFSSSTEKQALAIKLEGISGPGTYEIDMISPTIRIISVHGAGPGISGNDCCWGTGNMTTTGSVTITSLTATRAKGTFSASLGPQKNTKAMGQLMVSGDFDVGLAL